MPVNFKRLSAFKSPGRKGHKHTEQTKRKISEALKRHHAGKAKRVDAKTRGKHIAGLQRHRDAARDHAVESRRHAGAGDAVRSSSSKRKAAAHKSLAKKFAGKLGKFGKRLLKKTRRVAGRVRRAATKPGKIRRRATVRAARFVHRHI